MRTVFHGYGPGRKTTGLPLLGGLVLAIAILSAGCLGQSYDAAGNGSVVSVTPGQEIRISLGETPSTGYVWHVNLTGDLTLTGTDFSSLGSLTGMPGGDSGTRTWDLTIGTSPVQKFSAVKERSGGGETQIVDQFEMTFVAGTGGG